MSVLMSKKDWAKYRVFSEDYVSLDDSCIELMRELSYGPKTCNFDIKQFLGPGDQVIMDFRLRPRWIPALGRDVFSDYAEAIIRLPGGYYNLIRIEGRTARFYTDTPYHWTPDAKIYPLPREI